MEYAFQSSGARQAGIWVLRPNVAIERKVAALAQNTTQNAP
jgi:hypothetical protein